MKLSPVEKAILVSLLDGDNVPANIADDCGHHAKSVSRSLSDLEDRGHVENKGRGVWTLTYSGVDLGEVLIELGDYETDRNTSDESGD